MASIIKIFKGDSSPNINFTIKRTDGTVVDLTGCTVRFKIQDPVTLTRTNDTRNTCTITNAANGQCTYAWDNTDLPDPGTYTANLQITYPTTTPAGPNQVETYGYTIQVTDTV